VRVDVALLCDAANVRDGLLYILGGGISRITRPTWPAPLGVDLALRICAHPSESGTTHTLNVFVQGVDGQRHAELNMRFTPQAAVGLLPGQEIQLPLPLDLRQIALPAAGEYSVEVLIDGTHQASLPVLAQ
jgi:hypothetical protein